MTIPALSRRRAALGVLAWTLAYAALWVALGGFTGSAVALALTGGGGLLYYRRRAAPPGRRGALAGVLLLAAACGIFALNARLPLPRRMAPLVGLAWVLALVMIAAESKLARAASQADIDAAGSGRGHDLAS
jgi:hypothetical protein